MGAIASRKDAAQVLVECNARFSRGAGRVRLDGLKKFPDLFVGLSLSLHDRHRLAAPFKHRAWLDLVVDFGLHPCFSPEKLSSSFQESS
jgi:hypothetical protein